MAVRADDGTVSADSREWRWSYVEKIFEKNVSRSLLAKKLRVRSKQK